MIPPFIPVLLMATQYNPEFNQIKAPQMTPQLNPGQVDLGIERVSAEFSRQESGLRENMKQMRDNQAAMQRSAKTEMDRTEMDWKNYIKLADFSKTISDQLVENQKDENKRIMKENMNQAFIDGADPVKQAEYQAKVQELSTLDDASIAVATEYQNRGGLPDVAYEIERRSGWAAYGYAVGVAQNGGKNYGAFLEANKDTVVGYRDDGSEIKLSEAQNSAEYLAAQKILRQQYMDPYVGLNPELLQEHLITPMRAEEDTQFAQWEKDFAENKKKERVLEQQGMLMDARQNPTQAARLTEQLIQKEALRNGGFLNQARKTIMDRWKTLAENGMLSSGQAQQIFGVLLEMGGGKRSFDSYPEARAVLAAAQLYENQEGQRIATANKLKGDEALRELEKQVAEEGPLTPEAQEKIRNDLRRLGVSEYDLKHSHALRTIDEAEAAMAEKEVRLLIARGAFIPEGLLKQINDNTLYKQAYQLNANRKVNMGLTKDNADGIKKFIRSTAMAQARTIGAPGVALPEGGSAIIRATEDARRWLAANRYKYENEMQAVEALRAHLEHEFTGREATDVNNVKLTGYDASPYNSKNLKDTSDSQELFEQQSETAKAHVSDLVQSGIPNPYAVGAIPGTEKELEKILADVKETGKIPPRDLNPRFQELARQSNGTATYEDIVKSQLKAVYDFDFDATYPDRGGVQVLKEGQDGLTLSEYEQLKVNKLLNVNPTTKTRFRAAADVQMSQNFAATGYTDGDLIADASLESQGYELNRGAIPGGYAGTVAAAAKKYNIPADILAGLLQQESSWNPNAYNVKSGATGIAQIVPKWHPDITPGVDPHADIMYAASYLRRLMDNEAKGDLKTAIYMYNAGPGTVLRYGAGASKENREYYPGVIEKSKQYRRKRVMGLRSNYENYVADSIYNSPDLVSPNLRGRIYQLA